ncbi:malto-oligosyltrehalose trehalohydrolase [Paraflavisolibacter sp. H34]|uniref:malto-oligosyltrehalose trehalohydrolase n=1 Tax=Huijunlia imazamoxiresistens TaxID=3127457 RepID=UPI0030166A7A
MNVVDIHRRRIGLSFAGSGSAEVLLWAPGAQKVQVALPGNELVPLEKKEGGYWKATTGKIKPGDRYGFLLNDGPPRPDPASLSQPDGVHGPSQALDLTAFPWTDGGWNNLPLEEYILYELHTGTFTPEGTFAAIEEKLDHLVELGVNAIEIMPVAQFPGDRNWGYDGVLPFAVQHSYGGAAALQQLVNACHRKGLAVVLDVVYNHFGPEGAYFGDFGPYYTDKYHTPWGNALNFDDAWCDGVRQYFIENALMWFRDFHIDALRLDAVHAIKDFSPVHILREIRGYVDQLMAETGRRHYLVVEMDLNDTRFIGSPEKGGYGMDAQWIDEFHHALRVTAGGDRSGYYSDFEGISHLAKAYKDAYVYDGQFSPHRKKRFGQKARPEEFSGRQFVAFSQNHDQVGNRMLGERTSQLVSFEMQKLLAGAVLVSPFLPMLFMGEEWAEPHPFLYFVSHTDPELAEAVRKGRKAEFAAFHAEGEAPDPVAEETFLESKLQWQLPQQEPHATMLRYYQALIRLRQEYPALHQLDRKLLEATADEGRRLLLLHRWHGAQHLLCYLNFSDALQPVTLPPGSRSWEKLFDSADPFWNGPAAAPATLPAASGFVLQPQSITIYTNNHV